MTDDFEGRKFHNKKGGTLEVLRWKGDRKGSHKYYPVICDKCSCDTELFPSPFLCKKSDIVKGVIPCGCGSYNYSGNQQKIILNRIFKDMNIDNVCIGWENNLFKNRDSKPIIFCNIHKTTTCRSKLQHVKSGQVSSCNECADQLRREKVCYPKLKATEDVTTYLKSIGGRFVEFVGDYRGYATKVEWVCTKGHLPSTTLESLVKNQNNCHICKGNGFRGYKNGYLYLTQFISRCGEKCFYKVGITNKNPSIRNRRQSNASKDYFEKPLAFIKFAVGYDALLLEKVLKDLYADNITTKETFPDGYTETFVDDGITLNELNGDLILLTGCSIFNSYTQVSVPIEERELIFKGRYWLVYTETLKPVKEGLWQ